MENSEDKLSIDRQKLCQWRCREQRRHLKRQLAVTDRLLSLIENALDDEKELFKYMSIPKTGSNGEMLCREMEAVNEERLGKIIKALSELVGIQHEILAVPLFKEVRDDENTRAKIESDRDISLRKLELELMKIDGAENQEVPRELLEALSGDEDDT